MEVESDYYKDKELQEAVSQKKRTKMTMFRYHWDKFHDIRAFEKLNLLKWFIKSKVFKQGSNIFYNY